MTRGKKTTYKIIRMYANTAYKTVIKRGLTLTKARSHCKNPETSSETCESFEGIKRTKLVGPWFDGYEEER